MHFVDDGIMERDQRRPVVLPIEVRGNDGALGNAPRVILIIAGEVGSRIAEFVAEYRCAPIDHTMDRLRVGIDQKLIGVEPFAAFGLVGAVDAIPVELPEFYAGNVTVPDKPRTLADGDNLGHFGAAILEE